MAKRKTAMEIVRENESNIKPKYEVTMGDMRELASSGDIWEVISNAYVLGYVRCQLAMKAGKAART